MLFSLGKMEVLEDYVHKSSDAALLKVRTTYVIRDRKGLPGPGLFKWLILGVN